MKGEVEASTLREGVAGEIRSPNNTHEKQEIELGDQIPFQKFNQGKWSTEEH